MSIFRYELAKIFRRRAVQITLIAFLAVNLFNLYTMYRPSQGEETSYYDAEQTVIRSLEGPLDDQLAARLTQRIEELQTDTGSKEYLTGSRSQDLDIYIRRLALLNQLYDYRLRAEELQAQIETRLEELEGSGHTYEVRRLQLMQNAYSSRHILYYYDLTGFKSYIKYDFSTLLTLLLLLLAIPPLFSSERELGMDVLLKTARHGRQHTVWCKLGASLIFATCGALLFFAVDLWVFQSFQPFNLWEAPLYSVTAFYNTPFNLTVGGFVLLNWTAKLLGFWVAALVIGLFSALCRRTYFAFFFGAGYVFLMMLAGDRLLLVNPLSLLTFEEHTKTFATTNVLGHPVLTVVAIPVALALVAVLLIVLTHKAAAREGMTLHIRLPKKMWQRSLTQRSAKTGGGEWRKRMVKQRLVLVVVLVTALRVLLAASDSGYEYFERPSDRQAYQAFMAEYGGELTAETMAFFEQESECVAADKAAATQRLEKLNSGEWTQQEYIAQQKAYVPQAQLSSPVWTRLTSDYAYVSEDPACRWLADTRGWLQLLGNEGIDICAVLLVILLAGVAFSFEWECGMADTVRVCSRGRWRLALSKVGVSLLGTVGVFLLFESFTLIVALGRYDLAAQWSYPVQTYEAFRQSGTSLTVGQVYLLSRLLRLLGLLLVQAIALTVSAVAKKSLNAVFFTVALVIVPYYLLRESTWLYILPNTAGLLAAGGMFTLPAFEAAQWGLLSAALVAVVGLTILATWRFAAKPKGGCGV